MIGRPAALAVWAVGLTLFLAPRAAAARPDYPAARLFGYQLQQDYSARHSQALVARLAGDEMKRRIFAGFGEEVMNSDSTREIWENQLLPGLVQELKALEDCPFLMLSRVLLLNGSRVIECFLLNDNGTYRMVDLWLTEEPGGEIKIDDLRFLGASLEYTRRIRDIFVLLGAESAGLPDAEELELSRLSRSERGEVSNFLRVLAGGDMNAAFQAWDLVAPDLKATPIWRDLRNTLVFRGSTLARAQAEADPRKDAYLTFIRAMADKDPAHGLAAVDAMLQRYREPAYFRMTKAELLLRCHRPLEALALAEETCVLNPLDGITYGITVRAAVASGRSKTALRILRQWQLVAGVALIDQQLEADASLKDFRASAEYLDWKQHGLAPGGGNPPTGSPAPPASAPPVSVPG